jgi:hypothetical protein
MSVVVDDAGSDHQAICIQYSTRTSTHLADLDDTIAADGDVGVEARYAGAVNNLSVPDDKIVFHCFSFAARTPRILFQYQTAAV